MSRMRAQVRENNGFRTREETHSSVSHSYTRFFSPPFDAKPNHRGYYLMRFVKLAGFCSPSSFPNLMITLNRSAPHGTRRDALFCWPLIWRFEAVAVKQRQRKTPHQAASKIRQFTQPETEYLMPSACRSVCPSGTSTGRRCARARHVRQCSKTYRAAYVCSILSNGRLFLTGTLSQNVGRR